MCMIETATREPEFEVRYAAGYQLRVARWWALPDSPPEPPLLIFNGIGANAELIQPFAERLGTRDIVTFDMPGIGGSLDPVMPYRPWLMAQAADAIMTAYGYTQLDVMGVSWGGAIAQQYAFQHARRVRRLVLAATSAGMVMVPGRLSALSKMIDPRRYTEPGFMLRHFDDLYGGSSDGLAAHQSRIRAPSRTGYLFQLAATAGWTSVAFLPLITAKTLIVMGGQDRLVRPVNGRILKALIRDARLEQIEDGGHLFLVTHADDSAGLIDGFLDEDELQAE